VSTNESEKGAGQRPRRRFRLESLKEKVNEGEHREMRLGMNDDCEGETIT